MHGLLLSLLGILLPSGIYLGFEDDDLSTSKQDNENVSKDDLKSDLENNSSHQTENVAQSSENIFWNFFKIKRSSKYSVNSEREKNRNFCFWFVQKIWGNPEVCE